MSFWGFEECIKVFLEVDNIHVESKLNIKFNSQLNIPATEKSKTGQGFKLTKKLELSIFDCNSLVNISYSQEISNLK